jgi:hypothetical protein
MRNQMAFLLFVGLAFAVLLPGCAGGSSGPVPGNILVFTLTGLAGQRPPSALFAI